MSRNFELIDLSHTIHHGMTTYKGLPAPTITDHLSREASKQHYDPGTEFHIGKIEMVANTGTYIDSPFHRYADGADLAGLDLYSLANLEGIVVKHDGPGRAIEANLIEQLDPKGKAVLFQTNWDLHWATEDYFSGQHPFVSEAAAQVLVKSGAMLVGIDSYNIDNTETGARPAHSILLKNNIPIVEHMCGLRELPGNGFKFFAVPVKVRDFGTFPVRAFAIVPK
jgi:kynurenine formamidase